MKKLILAISLIVSALILTPKSFADNGCSPIYGGGDICLTQKNLSIDKKINQNDFKAGEKIVFDILISNTSNRTIKGIEFKDYFPSYIDITNNPGKLNKSNRTVELTFDLEAKKSRNITISGIVNNNIDEDICLFNYSQAKNGKSVIDDNTRFCLEKSTFIARDNDGNPIFASPKGIKKTPATGPSETALITLFISAIGGYALIRKTRKFNA